MKHLALVLAILALCGCQTPISNSTNPATRVASILPTPFQDVARADLIDNAYNLDQAQAIGIIAASSKVPACAHLVNQALGIEPMPDAPPIQTFTPKVGGIVSAGSVAYIDALKLAAVQRNGITISQDCVEAWGELSLQGLGRLFSAAGGLPITITPDP